MIFGSVCSGIEAATVAWAPLGWRAAFYSEVAPFQRAVLAHHYPGTVCHGDFTALGPDDCGPIDVLAGGTPCQSFSVAGLRGGLDDARGNLALEFFRLADRLRPVWIVWENVPGVLSLRGGRDFGCILGALAQLGYGWAYRVLDARHFGVPQRRRRVFVVGHLGDWRRAAAVLFDRESLRGNAQPRRRAKEAPAPGAGEPAELGRLAFGGNRTRGAIEVATAVNAHGGTHGRLDFDTETFIAEPFTLTVRGRSEGARLEYRQDGTVNALLTPGGGRGGTGGGAIARPGGVRRLTPREWERLQGFPDDYTLIDFESDTDPDALRYGALGGSMAVPVMRWLGERIEGVHALAEAA